MSTQSDEVKLAVIQTDIGYIKDYMKLLDEKVGNNYVTKSEHATVVGRLKFLEKTVYTGIGVILVALIGAGMSALLK